MFLINFNQWKCACVGINNWVISLRARYKCNLLFLFVTTSCLTFRGAVRFRLWNSPLERLPKISRRLWTKGVLRCNRANNTVFKKCRKDHALNVSQLQIPTLTLNHIKRAANSKYIKYINTSSSIRRCIEPRILTFSFLQLSFFARLWHPLPLPHWFNEHMFQIYPCALFYRSGSMELDSHVTRKAEKRNTYKVLVENSYTMECRE